MQLELVDCSQNALNNIVRAGRNCYQSQSKGYEADVKLVKALIAAGHCYDGETEVLTKKGFIKWKYYNGEEVAVVNKDGSFKSFEIPESIISYLYSGKVYDYEELGTILTEGHKLYGRSINNKKYNSLKNSYEYIYKLFSCNDKNISKNTKYSSTKIETEGERLLRIPSCCYKDESKSPLYELLGFWVGDGCRGYNGNKLIFHLKLKRKISYLENLCELLGYKFIKHKNNKYVVEAPFNIGKLVNEKYVKEKEKTLPVITDSKSIAGIIYGLLNSDGTTGKKNNHTSFSSTSRNVIEWIKNYACLAGFKVSENKAITPNGNRKKLYNITLTHFTKRGCPHLINDSRKEKRVKIYEVKEFPVYCVQVSTGIIVVRGKNCQTFLCGNCSPLEFGWAMFHVKGISRACADQLRTHRLLSFTMMSQRYVDISEQEFIHPFKALEFAGESVKAMEQSQKDFYKLLVKNGVPKEDARMYIGMGMSTEVYFACNFRELRHILKLRLDKHAQAEIRKLARGVYDICQERWPWVLDGILED